MRLALILVAALLASRAHAQPYPPFPAPLTAGHCISALNGFQGQDAGAPCGTGSVNAGLINQLAWYASAGSAVSGLATANNGTLVTSAGGVPSIASTLPAAVQGNITSLGRIASGTWQGAIVGGTYGGTGVNNGSSTITLGGSLTMSGAFTTALTVTGATALTLPTSGTVTAQGNTVTGTGSIVLAASPIISGTATLASFTATGSGQIGTAALTTSAGELGFAKIAASGAAPGASGGKVELVCGTNSGSAKLIAYAGTSSTPVTILDNIGSGVSGC